MKKYIFTFVCMSLFFVQHCFAKPTPQYNQTLKEEVKNLLDQLKSEYRDIDQISVLNMIETLRTENKKLENEVVKIEAQLASMRAGGGGKGAFKPECRERAHKLIAQAHKLDQIIRDNKLMIKKLLAENS